MSFLVNPYRFGTGPGGWTLRQSKAVQQNSYSVGSSSLAVTLDIAPVVGSLLMLAYGSNDIVNTGSPTVTGFTLAFACNSSLDPNTAGLLYKLTTGSEGTEHVMNFPANMDHSAAFMMEWTYGGGIASVLLDGTPATTQQSALPYSETPNITISGSNSLLVAVHTFADGDFTTPSWTNGFVHRHFYNAEVTGPDMSFGVATAIKAPAIYNTRCTPASGSDNFSCCGIAGFIVS